MSDKNCLECGEQLVGRSDKKYCGDHCRSQFNNRINKDQTNFMRNVNNLLRKNRRILDSFVKIGRTKIHRDLLLENGFNFSYCTAVHWTNTGSRKVFCYDRAYVVVDDDYLLVVNE